MHYHYHRHHHLKPPSLHRGQQNKNKKTWIIIWCRYHWCFLSSTWSCELKHSIVYRLLYSIVFLLSWLWLVTRLTVLWNDFWVAFGVVCCDWSLILHFTYVERFYILADNYIYIFMCVLTRDVLKIFHWLLVVLHTIQMSRTYENTRGVYLVEEMSIVNRHGILRSSLFTRRTMRRTRIYANFG